MISLVQYKTSSIIRCLLDKGYDKATAHSGAFLILLSQGETDFSGFEPTNDGVIYTEYVEASCGNTKLPNLNYPPQIIRELSKKLWLKIVGKDVNFNNEEVKIINELGIEV